MAGHVLVIDDSLTIRTLVNLSLAKANYHVELAETGGEGVARATKTPPDLILLDYMLPDKKGTDVWRELRANEATANIPIVLMSAKNENIRTQFAGDPQLRGYIGKPFSVADIVEQVAAICTPLGPPPTEGPAAAARPRTFSRQEQERGAQVIFQHLRDGLAALPTWQGQMGTSPPAPFLARRLLTPEVVAGILGELTPMLQTHAAPTSSAEPQTSDKEALLQGKLALMPVAGLLRVLSAYGRTGLLTLNQADRQTLVYYQRGAITLATCHDPLLYGQGAPAETNSAAEPALDAAYAEQRQEAMPYFVSLAEQGDFPPAELPGLLYEQGKRLLLEAVALGEGDFVWHEEVAVPVYVDTYGKPLALTQLSLERLRQQSRNWSPLDHTTLTSESVYERAPGFSRKLRGLELDGDERRVLSLVDGRAAVRQIMDRTDMTPQDILPILYRLGQVGLVRTRGASNPGSLAPSGERQTIAIVEPDQAGFSEPLSRLLANRQEPIQLVSLDLGGDWASTIANAPPSLLIVNATSEAERALHIAQAVRSTLEVSDMPLVAVLELPNAAQGAALRAAGFDAVLTKPVAYADLERVMAS